jgi:hypothetical protein
VPDPVQQIAQGPAVSQQPYPSSTYCPLGGRWCVNRAGGGLVRNSSGSLAILAAIRRASSRVSSLARQLGMDAFPPDSRYHWRRRTARDGAIAAKGSPVVKIFALTVALLMAISPVAAQQQQQQALGAGGKTNNSILPNNGLICIEEMVATFCNQPTGPNLAGYGSRGSSATSGTSAANGSSAASGVGAASSSGISTTSIPPCGSFPPPNELCN